VLVHRGLRRKAYRCLALQVFEAFRASYAKGSSLDKTVGRYSATVG
jgi:hypothetical protein